jgi:hypothetical protein
MTNDARSGFRKNPTPAAVLCVLATSARKGSNRLHDRSETPRRGRAPPFRCSWRLVKKYFLAAIRSPPAGPWPPLVAAAEPFFPPSASCAIPEQPWPKRNVSLTRIPNTDACQRQGSIRRDSSRPRRCRPCGRLPHAPRRLDASELAGLALGGDGIFVRHG